MYLDSTPMNGESGKNGAGEEASPINRIVESGGYSPDLFCRHRVELLNFSIAKDFVRITDAKLLENGFSFRA